MNWPRRKKTTIINVTIEGGNVESNSDFAKRVIDALIAYQRNTGKKFTT